MHGLTVLAIALLFVGAVYQNLTATTSRRIQSLLRLKKVEADPITYDILYPIKCVINQYNYLQYVTGYFKIISDVQLHLMQAQIHRCGLEGTNCRHFNTFNVTNVQDFLYAKNAPWSNATNAINPKLRLPNLSKGWYTITNATFDPELLTIFIPDSTKYYWKVVADLFDQNQKKWAKIYVDFTVIQYTERHRTKKPSEKVK